MCHISGPGLISATVNEPTKVLVEPGGKPFLMELNVTAQLEFPSNPAPLKESRISHKTVLPVATISPSLYVLSYTAVSRGQHKIHVQVNDGQISGSPFNVTVYPDPRQLACPVMTVTGITAPYGITFNKLDEMIVSEYHGHKLSIFDNRRQKNRTIGSRGISPDQMFFPAGIVTDDANNIYVSSQHRLQKFTNNGELIRCVGQLGQNKGEFNLPLGLAMYNNQLYVCDSKNHRIQVFDLELNFIRFIGSIGKTIGKFIEPRDIKFDTSGYMYVAERGGGNPRVQVLDRNGQLIRIFGREEPFKTLRMPSCIFIADKYLYIADYYGDCILVYETSGTFVTSFGKHGRNEREFHYPYSISSCAHGLIYVCDNYNNRIQIY